MTNNLEKEIQAINKQYGPGSIMYLSDNVTPIDRIPLNIYSLDYVLGGGLPKGRVMEIYGNESSGKTTYCLHAIISAQSLGLTCAFIDVEHGLDLDYAQKMGVDVKKVLISQPTDGEEALDICERLIRSNECGIIIVDSVAALVPRAEIEGEMGDAHMGLQARLMSQAMRKLVGITSKSKTVLIFTNQTRSKFVAYGNPMTVSGGNALKFYSSIRIELNATSQKIEENNQVLGYTVKVKCVKNKTAAPYRTCNMDLIYGLGFDSKRDAFNVAVEREIIEKKGAWYYWGEEKWQGKENAILSIDLDQILTALNKEGRK